MKVALNKIRSMILGHAIGDALGVPVEFSRRENLELHPVKGMRRYGTHNQPAGTWSDDTSTVLATMVSIISRGEIDLHDIMNNFLNWALKAEFTATGTVFDIGNTTYEAIQNYARGVALLNCGLKDDRSNGNGSLMRIAPLPLYLYSRFGDGYSLTDVYKVSSLTHGHRRTLLACGIYTMIAVYILSGYELHKAIESAVELGKRFYERDSLFQEEMKPYRFWNVPYFQSIPKDFINSGGYVVDTLEAVIWCLLNTNNYKDCLLTAVNLGRDTDTIGAIVGGLAGLYYEESSIPKSWLNVLKRRRYIEEMCGRFYEAII